MLAFILSVIVHECGHLAAARLLGVPVRRIRAGAFGLRLTMDFSAVSYGKELCVLLAGSGAGLVFSWIAGLCGQMQMVQYGIVLSIGNLLPIRGMDGGAVLETLFSCFLMPETAYRIANIVSLLTVIAVWIASLWICLRIQVHAELLLLSLWLLWEHVRTYF